MLEFCLLALFSFFLGLQSMEWCCLYSASPEMPSKICLEVHFLGNANLVRRLTTIETMACCGNTVSMRWERQKEGKGHIQALILDFFVVVVF